MRDRTVDIRDRPETQASRSFGDVFGDLSNELHTLVHRELQSAKDELRAAAPRTGTAARLLAGAAAAALFAVLFASFAVAMVLAELMPLGFAYLAVAAAYGVGAVVLYKRRQAETAPSHEPVDGNDY